VVMGKVVGGRAEPPASRFMVIRDRPVTIRGGEDIDRVFNFFFGSRVWLDEQIVISFLLINTEELRLEVNINGDIGYTQNYLAGPERVIQKVLKPAGREGQNQLTLIVHQGSCIISDLVIWYYVNP
jgi:hypothetical protein